MNTITIDVMQQQQVYELLCILDFDNVRKRMSVSHATNIHTYIHTYRPYIFYFSNPEQTLSTYKNNKRTLVLWLNCEQDRDPTVLLGWTPDQSPRLKVTGNEK